MKLKTLFLPLSLSALVCLADVRAITIAEHTLGADIETAVAGQSFTTVAGGPASNITFNFFSDVPATTPYAQGLGYLYSMEYTGTLGNIGSGPGFLGQATPSGGFYTFDPALTLSPLTQYFFYTRAFATISFGGVYAGGQAYGTVTDLNSTYDPDPDGRSWNFRVTGTPVSGVPDTGTSALLLGLSFIGIFVVQRAIGWRQQRVA
ncbi:MAG TPA: VPDSG-CTERM sorting domain-containing protein [Terrimicrobiaceae bacterium]